MSGVERELYREKGFVIFRSSGTVLKEFRKCLTFGSTERKFTGCGYRGGIKGVSGMTKVSLKKAIIGLENYVEENIREMFAGIKERREKSGKTKSEKRRNKKRNGIYLAKKCIYY
ncbi:hypothetical protein NPIL_314321 [Nephila pilipes]|uniref:Uncharacterized protein n=1 Tax=Nephila pilipes TaxID=299642 RepID=A0A8X6MEN8_NEPPI|nr:hypothetical protein NPIL_314321 [Nephila pilipes]